jgi:uncharacterized protein
MRVFLDANVLFSAAKSHGAVRELMRLMLAAGHVLVADGYVVAEARRNLEAKGPHALGALDEILSATEVARYLPARLPTDLRNRVPEKDRPVLAAALRLRCDALVTGDRTHFGPLYGTVQRGVAIHSPRSLAESPGL